MSAESDKMMFAGTNEFWDRMCVLFFSGSGVELEENSDVLETLQWGWKRQLIREM